jgi:uncharacterized protein (DUF305 family)
MSKVTMFKVTMFKVTMLIVGLLVLFVSACASTAPAANTPQETPAANSDEHAGHNMGDSTSDAPYDALFIDGMIEHHAGAVTMAEEVLVESERPELLEMAEAIIATQSAEIEQMQAWRSEWFPDLPLTEGMAMEMGAMSISTDTSVHFDQRFLEAMISHHEGALHMAEEALAASKREEIRTLAEAITATQSAEIEQMRGWLAEWFGVSQ